MKQIRLILSVVVLSVICLIACNEDNDKLADGKGRLNVYLTDAPFPVDLIEKTIVSIDRIEIKKIETDTTDASFITISEEEVSIDLLKLTNGVTEQIGTAELVAGGYDMIRLHVVDSKVILKDQTEFNLKVPGGSASGLKIRIHPAIEIIEGQTADVLLDFDVSKSFVVKGSVVNNKINGFNFKPVVRGVLLGLAGRIEGNVTDTVSAVLEDALIKVWFPDNNDQKDDSLVTSSFTDDQGNYKAIGLSEGSYSVTAELEGFKTDTITNLVVISGSSTVVDIGLEPVSQ